MAAAKKNAKTAPAKGEYIYDDEPKNVLELNTGETVNGGEVIPDCTAKLAEELTAAGIPVTLVGDSDESEADGAGQSPETTTT